MIQPSQCAFIPCLNPVEPGPHWWICREHHEALPRRLKDDLWQAISWCYDSGGASTDLNHLKDVQRSCLAWLKELPQ